jgi:TolB-like protein/Tfp pilus assembly protein PilF
MTRRGAIYRFGPFALDSGERRLSRSGVQLHLRHKTFEVLAVLVERQGHRVGRQALLDAVWPDVEVTDNTLSRCVREIRAALRDEARDPSFVRTVTKVGYEFIAPVERIDAPPGGPESGPQAASDPASLPSIVVLPFQDMSEDGTQEYFCDGLAEEVISALARLTGLRVVARTSAFAFKARPEDVREIGRKLGVANVLEGSVRRSGDRLRVTVQLVSSEDGCHLWSERYDRAETDIFALQDAIAIAIADRLRVQLLPPRRHTGNLGAYDLFLQGRFFQNRRHPGDFPRAMGFFQQALEREPTYVQPLVATAESLLAAGVWGLMPPESFKKAEALAARALNLDPAVAEAHLVLAAVAFLHERDRAQAEMRFELAFHHRLREPLARIWYSLCLIDAGREDDAIANVRESLRLDPLSAIAHSAAAAACQAVGRGGEARELARRAHELDPSSPVSQHWLGWCLASGGEDAEAEVALRGAAASGLGLSAGALAAVLVRTGRPAEARELVRGLEGAARDRYVARFPLAMVYAALGEVPRSLSLVDEALESGEPVALCTLGRLLTGLLPEAWAAEAKGRSVSKRPE